MQNGVRLAILAQGVRSPGDCRYAHAGWVYWRAQAAGQRGVSARWQTASMGPLPPVQLDALIHPTWLDVSGKREYKRFTWCYAAIEVRVGRADRVEEFAMSGKMYSPVLLFTFALMLVLAFPMLALADESEVASASDAAAAQAAEQAAAKASAEAAAAAAAARAASASARIRSISACASAEASK